MPTEPMFHNLDRSNDPFEPRELPEGYDLMPATGSWAGFGDVLTRIPGYFENEEDYDKAKDVWLEKIKTEYRKKQNNE